MNLSLLDPFALAQDYPESLASELRSGHSTCVRFNRKGHLLASGRLDGTIVLFDVETNSLARYLRGHVRQIQSLSWSHDGKFLVSCGQDYKAISWDLSKTGDGASREVRFNAPVYCAELHPRRHDKFVSSLYEEAPFVVDLSTPWTVKRPLPTAPKRPEGEADEKRAAADAKQLTTATIWTASGDYIITGTNKGWINIISASTLEILSSTRITNGCVTYLRLTQSGRNMAVNSSDRIIRSIHVRESSDGKSGVEVEVEHKFQDVVNRLLWNHVSLSGNGEYVSASTYKNHDIYVWERSVGALVKILEGPKEELGVCEWHPTKPLVAAVGLETGRIYMWATSNPQRWSALAPDFRELEENVEYEEREDEFDVHDVEDVKKRRLHLETEVVDVLGGWQGTSADVDEEEWRMPVVMGLDDTDSEPEDVRIEGPGHLRRKSPGKRNAEKDKTNKRRKVCRRVD